MMLTPRDGVTRRLLDLHEIIEAYVMETYGSLKGEAMIPYVTILNRSMRMIRHLQENYHILGADDLASVHALSETFYQEVQAEGVSQALYDTWYETVDQTYRLLSSRMKVRSQK